MQARSSSRLVGNLSSNPTPSTNLNPKGRNRRRSKQRIDDFNLEELSPPIVTMADQRTMAQLLQAPTEGYEDAFVFLAITADNFKLKHGLITLVQRSSSLDMTKKTRMLMFVQPEFGWRKNHLGRFFTWDDLVSKFINQFIPQSKTTNLRNEITNFQQSFDESFSKAWDRFKDLLRACPHHGFSELHQLDTFYNALNSKDQDSLNSAAGVSTNASTFDISSDVAELKDMVKALLLDKKSQNQSPAPMKAVKESCVTCGGAHSYRDYLATDGNVYRDNIQEFVSQASAVIYNQGNTSYRPLMMSNQIRPLGFPLVPNNQNVQRNNQKPFHSKSKSRTMLCGSSQKLPKKLEDPSKFLIPCDFLELADRSISRPVRVAEDVYVKVGSFHFLADFVVIDFDADPRVPLILERSFLKTERALIDVFEGELTLCVGKEAITFNQDQTSRYSTNYSDMMAKRIDVIDMAYEEYSQEVLGFSYTILSGSPTLYYDLIISATSSTLTPFKNSDFLLEEVDAFLAIEDEPTSFEFYQPYLDPEGDILLLEAFLNDVPLLPPPNQRNYLPEVRKELKICKAKADKSLVDEPLVVELKDLPPHLEYAFLEGDDKLPVIIAKDLSVEEKTTLITVLKSHTRAIAWKLSDIKDSPWVSPVHCVPKKGGFTVVENDDNELIPTRLVMGWRVCIDYRKLNEATRKDHVPLPFMDQMLERLAGNLYYCFLDGFFGYFQISINPKDHEKTTFTFSYGTFAYCRMPFGLCNSPGTFQRILKRCEDTNLCLNWEKSYFMVKKGIVIGHKISKQGIKVDKAKVDVITKLPHPTTIKGENRASCSDKLDDALWAFRTAYKTPIGSGDHRKVQSNELNELHDQAYENSMIYKEKIKRFSPANKSRWSGPFKISQLYPYGTVKLSQPDGPNFKVNGHRLKHYFGEDVPKLVVPNLQTFARDH
uniref:Uncharacterized protein n=1 Tax=Tanacetum cinerariifolium TaxID=118510 RepID=A0A699HIP5_TANCI|nr:hypothetical protein [Tanacetum cinerariifolium]